MKTLYVINPNSSNTVTDGIAQALSPLYALAKGQGVRIDCLTLAEGPPGIESQAQADLVIAPMLHMAAGLNDAAGFVGGVLGLVFDRRRGAVDGEGELAGQRFGVLALDDVGFDLPLIGDAAHVDHVQRGVEVALEQADEDGAFDRAGGRAEVGAADFDVERGDAAGDHRADEAGHAVGFEPEGGLYVIGW